MLTKQEIKEKYFTNGKYDARKSEKIRQERKQNALINATKVTGNIKKQPNDREIMMACDKFINMFTQYKGIYK